MFVEDLRINSNRMLLLIKLTRSKLNQNCYFIILRCMRSTRTVKLRHKKLVKNRKLFPNKLKTCNQLQLLRNTRYVSENNAVGCFSVTTFNKILKRNSNKDDQITVVFQISTRLERANKKIPVLQIHLKNKIILFE